MATRLTAQQEQQIQTALIPLRARAAQLTAQSPSTHVTSILEAVAATVATIVPTPSRPLHIVEKLVSFKGADLKNKYYASTGGDDQSANTTCGNVLVELRQASANMAICYSEYNFQSDADNDWHATLLVYSSNNWDIITSEGSGTGTVRKQGAKGMVIPIALIGLKQGGAFKEGRVRIHDRGGPVGQMDCVRFAVESLLDLVIPLLNGEVDPI